MDKDNTSQAVQQRNNAFNVPVPPFCSQTEAPAEPAHRALYRRAKAPFAVLSSCMCAGMGIVLLLTLCLLLLKYGGPAGLFNNFNAAATTSLELSVFYGTLLGFVFALARGIAALFQRH